MLTEKGRKQDITVIVETGYVNPVTLTHCFGIRVYATFYSILVVCKYVTTSHFKEPKEMRSWFTCIKDKKGHAWLCPQ